MPNIRSVCVCVCVCMCVFVTLMHLAANTRHEYTTQSHYPDTGPISPKRCASIFTAFGMLQRGIETVTHRLRGKCSHLSTPVAGQCNQFKSAKKNISKYKSIQTIHRRIRWVSEWVIGVLRRLQQSFSYITTVAACCMRRDIRSGFKCCQHWCTVPQTQYTNTPPSHIILTPGQPVLVLSS